ncbi:ClC family H(+)/Cl(-) exchange transporter [Periweissella cryptocerci]|uniref:ClC family H(+)/Cl(-) exchange transporter n=1 Tax=Periweissella cryptocerci TaxID=2506420 RepID=A0A4P6YUD6_9LACO|nr:ClC family H(+)/Cl(-) exchange transporter [Periweissella cryptocerci]QBO36350.1 ClC family H(+)/Cl(-) exchange transporter [Periweissella cryptocerci]
MNIDRTRLNVVLRAIVVGLLVGIVVSAFRWAIGQLLEVWKVIYHTSAQNHWLMLVVILGMVGLAWIIGKITGPNPNVMGSGIPQVEGQLHGQIEMNAWSVLWRKFVAGILAIGTGTFLGREGPSIQLGAAVGQLYAEKRHFKQQNRSLMIATGAAAGLAAAFSAPIAGTMFVLEEIYRSFSVLVWLGALTGALTADLVAQEIFGLTPVLAIHYTHVLPLHYYWILVILGLVLGLAGYCYQRVILWMPRFYQLFSRIPREFQGVVPLLLVIPVGIYFSNTLGGGATLIQSVAKSVPGLGILVGLLLLRFVFSMISYGSGLPGGIFLPILTLGALIGAIVGMVFVKMGLLPNVYIPNLIIFAMAGYFAGISKAPFTAIILITEMVGSLMHLLPLALVALVAYLVVDLLGGTPIYESLLARLQLTKR